jgi:hemerythrin-like domain-containing protein
MDARNDRRSVLLVGAAASLGLVAAACGGPSGGAESPHAAKGEEDISPAEDLMREHGVLNRILLIYEDGIRRLEAPSEKPPADPLRASANIIRRFIEDYHEKLEEDFLFSRFETAGKLVDLVAVLRHQHQAGRKLTDEILRQVGSEAANSEDARRQLAGSLRSFIRMYRPHEAREDTVLFPALRTVISPKELEELGERFEEKEYALFGKEGFEGIVVQVGAIEEQLGIGNLATFTPS